jgi:hypothetical protein
MSAYFFRPFRDLLSAYIMIDPALKRWAIFLASLPGPSITFVQAQRNHSLSAPTGVRENSPALLALGHGVV